ncbi:laminin subunit beta-1-like [Saccostrea cucullata]|uniref:laminin subunit beta-1-like n=1 Tax=Saccostrea cuccullata TaxID=36930 RepID=UPI002ED4CBA5
MFDHKNWVLFFVYFSVFSNATWKTRTTERIFYGNFWSTDGGNLLIGRRSFLKASSTCGLRHHENICNNTGDAPYTRCFRCDSRTPWSESNSLSHQISNVLYDTTENWWQSQLGQESVFIQFDLETTFWFTGVTIKFRNHGPKAFLIERSSDFARTWRVYRYFAESCNFSWPGIKFPILKSNREYLNIFCQEIEYKSAETLEISFFLSVPPHVFVTPLGKDILNLITFTNLRINFTAFSLTHYYSVYNLRIEGTCMCYGHASRCKPFPGYNFTTDTGTMVNGKCVCKHKTTGQYCEKCREFYNERPWQPADFFKSNKCKRCNCNGHSKKCGYDPLVVDGTSGGICLDCDHNTTERFCQTCQYPFEEDSKKPVNSKDFCVLGKITNTNSWISERDGKSSRNFMSDQEETTELISKFPDNNFFEFTAHRITIIVIIVIAVLAIYIIVHLCIKLHSRRKLVNLYLATTSTDLENNNYAGININRSTADEDFSHYHEIFPYVTITSLNFHEDVYSDMDAYGAECHDISGNPCENFTIKTDGNEYIEILESNANSSDMHCEDVSTF